MHLAATIALSTIPLPPVLSVVVHALVHALVPSHANSGELAEMK